MTFKSSISLKASEKTAETNAKQRCRRYLDMHSYLYHIRHRAREQFAGPGLQFLKMPITGLTAEKTVLETSA